MEKIKTILIISILLFATKTHAQSEKAIKIQIERSIASYFNTQGSEFFEKAPYKNSAFTFGIAISINKNGVIDSILYSNKTALLDSIVSFTRIAEMLKDKKIMKVFSNHKNTVFLSVVLLRKSWEHSIENLEDFDSYFYNMIPNIDMISRLKKIRVLPAITMVQGRKEY